MWYLLTANTTFAYTKQDTLAGSNGPGRAWWDVKHYNLSVTFDTASKSITGTNKIFMRVTDKPTDSLQLDLQEPMVIDKIVWRGQSLSFSREGNVWWVKVPTVYWHKETDQTIIVDYHGTPREAKMPPWEGGFIWKEDGNGNPWISVACQGLGASSWWPCKDIQSDEPDNGMNIAIKFPEGLKVVSNGRQFLSNTDCGITTTVWGVKNPINTYNTSFYIGDYVSWKDTIMGEKGMLDLSFYVLRENEEKARKHFAVTKNMLHCFEYWMGPYPFYEDGYKLVEAPFLGMEHQSAVAYGNEYKMGYRGEDRSSTGVGTQFDFIIIHESGHEWFGNNITAADVADNWLHEGFTTYTEALFAEWILSKEKAFEYARGEWKNIRNDKPVIGDYGVKDDGSSDKYDKGAAVVHMIRIMLNDDAKFRGMLRELNKTFYHKTVTTGEIEQYIIAYTRLPLQPLFDQYLRSEKIPELEWSIKKNELNYRFTNTPPGFTLPLQVTDGEKTQNIKPTNEWQSVDWRKGGYNVSFSKDFLIKAKP